MAYDAACPETTGDECEEISQRIDRLVDDYNGKIMKRLKGEYVRTTKRSDRLADNIAAFGGSWRFIIIFAAFLALWVIWNIMIFTTHFDPPPFILLNLILSFIAAFQAPIIMMSQNRHAEQDKHEAVIDFAINYRAGQEVDDIQSHLHRMEEDIQEIKKMMEEMAGERR